MIVAECLRFGLTPARCTYNSLSTPSLDAARPVEQAMGAEDEKPVTGAATVALLWEISDAATDHGGDPVT